MEETNKTAKNEKAPTEAGANPKIPKIFITNNNTMDKFLPEGYSIPNSGNKHMKLEEGENKFRVLSSAITGWEYWIENEKTKKPVRVRTEKELPTPVKTATENKDKARHFWAFVVFNRKAEEIQILELTQKTIMAAIQNLVRSEKWGDPKNYDIVISRSGEGFDTEYSVLPDPKEDLEEIIQIAYKDMNIDLNALYEGNDPFANDNFDSIPTDLGYPLN